MFEKAFFYVIKSGWLNIIQDCSPVPGIILGFLLIRKQFHPSIKIFHLYLISTLLFEITGILYASHSINTFYKDVFSFSIFYYLFVMAYTSYFKDWKYNSWFNFSIILIPVVSIGLFFTGMNIIRIYGYIFVIYSVLSIILCFSYFIYIMDRLEIIYLEREPLFWITIGILINVGGTILLEAMNEYVIEKGLFSKYEFGALERISDIFLNFMIFTGMVLYFWKKSSNKRLN